MGFQVAQIINDKLDVNLASSKVEKVTYNTGNPVPKFDNGTSYSADFNAPRTTGTKIAVIPHSAIGVFEQSIMIYSTLDVDFTVKIFPRVSIDNTGTMRSGAEVANFNLPPSAHSSLDRHAMITTEKIEGAVESDRAKIISLPELRLPYEAFRIDVTPVSAPTSGEVVVTLIRRY